MNRIIGLILSLAMVALAGACASAGTTAQAGPEVAGPPNVDNEWTQQAESNITVAQLRGDPAEQRQLYQEALTAVQTGLQTVPQNPKLWFLAGQAYVGLDDYVGADSAFTRAERLYPEYAPDIAIERENAWVEAYNAGVQALQQDSLALATRNMERAESIYDKRPEALINLGWLYSRQDQQEQAIDAYQRGLDLLRGPVAEGATPEDSANWKENERVVAFNLAQLYSGIGVERFQAEDHAAAAEAFRSALELNPYSRDNLYNLAQALYVQTADLEEALAEEGADSTAIEADLGPLYEQVIEVTSRVRELDPYNSNVLLILARAYRGLGEVAVGTPAEDEWKGKALEVLQHHQDMPYQVRDIQLSTAGAGVRLAGTIQNVNLSPGAPIRLLVTFLDVEGAEVGSTEVMVSAPAQEQATPFEASLPQAESVVGWKYAPVSQAS